MKKFLLEHFKGTKAMTRGHDQGAWIAFVASVKYQVWASIHIYGYRLLFSSFCAKLKGSYKFV